MLGKHWEESKYGNKIPFGTFKWSQNTLSKQLLA